MNFDLTEDQRAVQETFARFADERIAPQAEALDEAHEFPRALFEQLGDLGFFGMRYPEEDGGTGLDLLSLCLAVTEIARGSASVAGVATMQSLMGTNFLWALGNDDIKSRLFAPALEGRKVGGICMTEPDSGSDLGGISTYAERTNSGYRLNGQKMWVTSAPVADFFTVFAKAGPERGLTIFLVERDFEGLEIGRAIDKMGVWALPTSEVAFNDCMVPETHRLCEEGEGEQHLRTLLAKIRVVTAAMAIGIARAAVDTAVQYASERKQFGKAINRFQAIQLKLADMGTQLDVATRYMHYAAWLVDNDRPHHTESAMAKLFASESAATICDQAARVMASYGYAMEYPAQRYLRDVRFTLIGGGTSEILKLIIAKGMSTAAGVN
jgi:butyryl-CoA dehydrogenase